ncbi:unnamed protein product [Arabis nemorensis]|uniref:Uncharacterized protein n=1 Tax=Arabis nemorensis TaxID=586526 RepID=A0A565AXM5_9BRAS|nr:unnamed protein product [Arabis nemorensis]
MVFIHMRSSVRVFDGFHFGDGLLQSLCMLSHVDIDLSPSVILLLFLFCDKPCWQLSRMLLV